MANIKITDLDNFADPNSTDVLPIVDVAEDETKKVSIGNLMKSAVAGTAALPGIAFAVDEDTGMYRNASDQLAFATGGTERILIDDSGVVTIAGDLTVNGTTTTIDSTTLTVEDKNIELGVVDTPSDTTADGGGITLKGATDKTINWVNATDAWTSSERFDFPAGTAAAPSVILNGDVDSGLYQPAANEVAISTGGTGRLFVDASGNLGVGTSAPDRVLEIKNAAPIIRLTDTDNNYSEISANTSVLSLRADESNGAAGTRIDFRVDGAEVARIDSDGRLLVGTNSSRDNFPTSIGQSPALQVEGTSAETGALSIIRNANSVTASAYLQLGKTRGTAIGDNTIVQDDDRLGYISFNGANGTDFVEAAGIQAFVDGEPFTSSDASDMPGRLVFLTSADGSGTPTERMRIDSSGNVGVGAISPSSILTVQASGTQEALFSARANAGAGGGMTIQTDASDDGLLRLYDSAGAIQVQLDTDGGDSYIALGSVGIGTSSPISSGKLTVDSDSSDNFVYYQARGANELESSLLFLTTNSSGTNVGGSIGHDGSTNTLYLSGITSGASTQHVSIDSNGNVGVGTTDPHESITARGNIFLEANSTAADSGQAIYWQSTTNGWNDGQAHAAIYGRRVDANDGYLRFDTRSDGTTAERARIDSSGRLLVGTNTSINTDNSPSLEIVATGTAVLSLGRNDSTISTGNVLGSVKFFGNDGGSYQQCAEIAATADGDHANDDKPTRLEFYTTADGGSSPTERMRIDSAGVVKIGTGSTVTPDANADDFVIDKGAADTGLSILSTTTGRIYFGDASDDEAGSIRYVHTDNSMRFETASTEALRIDSSGRLLIGHSSSIRGGALEVLGETANTQIQVTESSDSGDGPQLALTRTRGSDLGSPSPVQDGNNLGRIRWRSWDSAAYRIGAEISVHADGQTWASSDCPTRLIFSVTADGGASPTERMRISQDGLTRFTHSATDTPKTVLHVDGSEITPGGGSAIFLKSSSSTTEDRFGSRIHTIRESSNNGASSLVISNENAGATGLDEAVRINSGGQVLIGSGTASSTESAALLQVIGDEGGQLCIARNDDTISTGNNIGQIRFRSADGGYQDCARIVCDSEGTHGADDKPSNLQFHVTADNSGSTTSRMRIGSAGQLDTFASAANALDIHTTYSGSTDIVFAVKTGATGLDDGTIQLQVLADGDVENTNNRYTAISDIKFKENIADANSQWDDLKAIRVVNFNYKEEKNWGTHRQIGVIAQEIEQVSPGLVIQRQEEGEGEEYKSVAYSVLYMKAIKALQEAMERIETLEAKVAALEAG